MSLTVMILVLISKVNVMLGADRGKQGSHQFAWLRCVDLRMRWVTERLVLFRNAVGYLFI
ncbi:MAG: hypothetical protein A3H35_00385 [Betaproteobacteria bacterium RIFCSPLOWO2_02_FULL_62_17]|nr:MAG: hypothetical protein A3H35_00385 [Betaproteobacteria bacterium RIFCSPLOWO2_02_FULL_62_17]